jgi:hypothetical protein
MMMMMTTMIIAAAAAAAAATYVSFLQKEEMIFEHVRGAADL